MNNGQYGNYNGGYNNGGGYNNNGGYNNGGGYNNNGYNNGGMDYGMGNGMNNGFQSIPPNNNLVLAIITTVFCCMPIGIYAIIKASNVDKYWNMGQHDLAINEANEAKKWSKIGIGIGAAAIILYLIFYVVMFVVALSVQKY